MPAGNDQHRSALNATISLVNFLVELTSRASRDPVRDVTQEGDGDLLWLGELPPGVRTRPRPDGVLLTLPPTGPTPVPAPPPALAGWIMSKAVENPDVPPPATLTGTDEQPGPELLDTYRRWLAGWRDWAERERRRRAVQGVYEWLDAAMKRAEQQDDEWELVLGAGLLCWQRPDGHDIRRHLLVQPLRITADQASAELTVAVAGERRMEERALLGGLEEFHPARGQAVHQELIDDDSSLLDEQTVLSGLARWLGLTVAAPVRNTNTRVTGATLPATAELAGAPALVLRRRGTGALAEAYQRIAAALAEPDAKLPIGLAQVVVDSEPEQRQAWLDAHRTAGSTVLEDEPLFPLPVNREQEQVLKLLRHETGVVVQGPPGTGKTHTIANLVSAMP